jgi:ABC-type transporter Mla MlaB component
MKIETHEDTLMLRGTVKEQDLPKLRDALSAALAESTVYHLDLSALRAADVYLLQLVATALGEARARERACSVTLSTGARELATKVGLEPYLAPFERTEVAS